MMNNNIKSLGYRADFIFNEFDGSVQERGDYIVAKTESNPQYFFWGAIYYSIKNLL